MGRSVHSRMAGLCPLELVTFVQVGLPVDSDDRPEDRAIRRTPHGHRGLPSYAPLRGAMNRLQDIIP
jgi:hypothetical protein